MIVQLIVHDGSEATAWTSSISIPILFNDCTFVGVNGFNPGWLLLSLWLNIVVLILVDQLAILRWVIVVADLWIVLASCL